MAVGPRVYIMYENIAPFHKLLFVRLRVFELPREERRAKNESEHAGAAAGAGMGGGDNVGLGRTKAGAKKSFLAGRSCFARIHKPGAFSSMCPYTRTHASNMNAPMHRIHTRARNEPGVGRCRC